MMNINNYTNPLPFSLTDEEKETISEQVRIDHAASLNRDVPGAGKALAELIRAAVKEAQQTRMKAYRDAGDAIRARFKTDLLEDLGISDHPKADLLFQMAWERGHSAGFGDVCYEAGELAELISD